MGFFDFLFGSRSGQNRPSGGRPSAQTYFARANAKAERGDLPGAIADFSKAIELEPQFTVAWHYRGCARSRIGNLEGALADLSEAIRLAPKCVPAYLERGNCYLFKGEYAQAIDDYNEAIRHDPKFAPAYYFRGLAYGPQGEHDKAITDLTEAVRLEPSSTEAYSRLARAYSNRGNSYAEKGEHGKAIADHTEAIRLLPNDYLCRYNRGVAYCQKGQDDNAAADYSKAIELEPTFALAWENRGCVRAGDLEGAIADFTKTIELDPLKASAFFRRGKARYEGGDVPGAAADFAKAIADPGLEYELRQAYSNIDPEFRQRVAGLIDKAKSPANAPANLEGIEPEAQDGYVGGLLGPSAAGELTRVASNLPAPPGFTWQRFEKGRMTVLRPDGWYVHQVGNDESFTGCVSKECIQTEGSLKTGLTLLVFRRVKDCLREQNPNYDPDIPVRGMFHSRYGPALFSDPCNRVLYTDQCVQKTANSRSIRFRYRQAWPGRPPIIVQKFLIDFDQGSDVYEFTFESPENDWDENWQKGKKILMNLVFSVDPSRNLVFSVDPPLPSDDFLQAKAQEVGRSMGWSLAYENRSEGLFIWRVQLPAPNRDAPATVVGCCFSWYMKRVQNEIWVDDSCQSEPVKDWSVEFAEQLATEARSLQEDFKRRWLALVGPVTLRGASPETHSFELKMKEMADLLLQEGR